MQKQENEFGDFEEIKEKSTYEDSKQEEQQGISRARSPKGRELIGIIVQRYGGNRMEVKTTDGKTRNCRVPGKYKRKLWLRPKDIILIIPWEDDDGKGDIIYKYPPAAIQQLRKSGVISSLTSDF